MENNIHTFTIGKQITEFHIPGNGVIINGLPKVEKKPKLTEIEILNSKIEMLESELQKAREDSYNEGYNACKRSISESNKEELSNQINLFSKFKSNLEDEIKITLSRIHDPIIKLSQELTQKIIERELDCSKEWLNMIENKIERYCEDFAKEISIDIKVNGNSIPKNQSFERKSDNKIIKFIIDDNLKPGECIIETDNNIIDATFKTQIQNLINDL